jgi:hypothetical protein
MIRFFVNTLLFAKTFTVLADAVKPNIQLMMAGGPTLKDQKQKDMLSKKLDTWVQKLKKDATVLTPQALKPVH